MAFIPAPGGGYISDAPVGPALDHDVWRCLCLFLGAHEAWRTKAFSTNLADGLELLDYLCICADLTLRTENTEEENPETGDNTRWIVDLVNVNPDDPDYEQHGEGWTLLEAVCRCATHMAEMPEKEAE